jgi:hypothetical protein
VDTWHEYDRWDEAFRDVVYSGAHAYQPVFLDVEDALLVEVARRRGLDLTADQAAQRLAADVRTTLMLGPAASGSGVLHRHQRRLSHWQFRRRTADTDSATAPPVIALLAVFARAAEMMGHDDQYTSAAYFPRLFQLLGVEKSDEQRFTAAYRRSAEGMWDALNSWLDGMGGAYGLPTAERIGFRYVGIALSQALIRDADRGALIGFFTSHDLEPGLRLSPEDMAAYLEPWARGPHAPSSLKRLLKTAAGRKLLSETAALALAQWDGAVTEATPGASAARPPLLTARVSRSGLGAARLRLGFVVRGSSLGPHAVPRRWRVTSAAGDPKPEVRLEALTDRYLAPELPIEAEDSSLLTGRLSLVAETDSSRPLKLERRPQPVVLLSYVDEAALFVEVERARMFETHMVLVNSAAKKRNGTPMFDIDGLLTEIAQPGFTKLQGVAGMPDGWDLYRDVTVVRRHDRPEFVLDPLRPAQTSALTVGGGLRMPGHAARWHADVALDISGTASAAVKVDLRLLRLEEDDVEFEVRTWSANQPEITVTTDTLQLPAGSYRAEMRAARTAKKDDTDSVATFITCTSDEPRLRPDAARVGYVLGSPTGPLAAVRMGPGSGDDGREEGLAGDGNGPSQHHVELARQAGPEKVWWALRRSPVEYAVLAEPAAPDSCAVTGAHREQIETHFKGMKFDRGECLRCGRVKLYSPNARPKKAADHQVLHVRPSLGHLGAVHERRPVRGETLLDALIWLGGGEQREIAHLVRQVDDSALAVDEIVRVLECLGHIDVVRDAKTFAVREWALAPRVLAGLEDGSWFVTGSWDRASLVRLAQMAESTGGVLQVDDDGWLPRRRVTSVEDLAVHEIGRQLDAEVLPSAGRMLLGSLPALSAVGARLPRTSAEGIFDANWFNPAVADWVPVQSIQEPGAYRLRKGFVSTYLFRARSDIEQTTAVRASSQAVKHLASTARPLIGYDPDSETLFVPLGAELPGLYGRALSLLSGQPPRRVAHQPLLAYASVTEEVAGAIFALMKE